MVSFLFNRAVIYMGALVFSLLVLLAIVLWLTVSTPWFLLFYWLTHIKAAVSLIIENWRYV